MREIKIKYLDWWPEFDPDNYFINRVLRKHYKIILSDDPDYVIGSMYTKEALSYDCIRIFYSGENFSPDFNLYDYALGFENMSYGDRYAYAPNYIMNPKYADDVSKMLRKHTKTANEGMEKTEFCSFVVSNGLGNPIRFDFFDELSKYKKVNSGGRYQNNIGIPEGVSDKYEFQKKHKFSICFENSAHPGYVTEKLVQGFAAGTVPIYWGAPDVCNIFNEKAMVVVNGRQDIPSAIMRIKEIDNNPELYQSMVEQPALLDLDYVNNLEQNLEQFLVNIFEQSIDGAGRRPRVPMVDAYYRLQKQLCEPEVYGFKKKLLNLVRK